MFDFDFDVRRDMQPASIGRQRTLFKLVGDTSVAHNLPTPMRTLSLVVLGLAVLLSACNCGCPPGDARCNSGVGGGGEGGGGNGGGGGNDPYERFTLDNSFSDRFYMDMVVDKTRNRVGVAYFAGRGEIPFTYLPGDAGIAFDAGSGVDAGSYELKYVEWEDGQVRAPQRVDVTRRLVGVSIDFHPTTGEPAIGYLGGGNDMSVFWDNSDAQLAVRSGGTTWTSSTAARTGYQVMCGNPVSDNPGGDIVGLWAAIAYSSTGTLWYCYRDVHSGQYPQQDWAGSDVECVNGSPGNWQRECVYPAGNMKDGPGGRIDMTMVNDQPCISWDNALGGADTRGQNVQVQCRNGTVWSSTRAAHTISDVQSGGSIAYDPTEGLGVAAVDLTDNILRYAKKTLAAPSFGFPDPVYGDGTGGWFPSLAMDPVAHEPAIAFYVCSPTSSQTAANCLPSYDGVRVTQRNSITNDWSTPEVVDDVSATVIRLGFLSDGRKVIAYRDRVGALKLAVRKVP